MSNIISRLQQLIRHVKKCPAHRIIVQGSGVSPIDAVGLVM
jgi:hypothetical protein